MHWLWYYFDNDNLDMPYLGMSRSIGGFYVSLWLQIALNQILPISVTEDKILLDSGQKYAIYHQNLVHLGLKNMQIFHLHIKEFPRACQPSNIPMPHQRDSIPVSHQREMIKVSPGTLLTHQVGVAVSDGGMPLAIDGPLNVDLTDSPRPKRKATSPGGADHSNEVGIVVKKARIQEIQSADTVVMSTHSQNEGLLTALLTTDFCRHISLCREHHPRLFQGPESHPINLRLRPQPTSKTTHWCLPTPSQQRPAATDKITAYILNCDTHRYSIAHNFWWRRVLPIHGNARRTKMGFFQDDIP